MVGATKFIVKEPVVYFGHPLQFWKERRKLERQASVDVEGLKKLSDLVGYDQTQLQRLITNMTSRRVEELLKKEEKKLRQKREKLRLLLERDEEEYAQELILKEKLAKENCEYCKERDRKIREYEQELEREKIRECQKALEREKMFRIKSIQQAKEEEIQLRQMQKLQMEERRQIEEEQKKVEKLWHGVLVEDVRRKEQKEREAYYRGEQEMHDRRRAYEEQIASATRRRQKEAAEQRQRETTRDEKMREILEREWQEAIRRKKEQQQTNRVNFIEGHRERIERIRREKQIEQEMDNKTISIALEKLKRERQKEVEKLHRIQKEEQIFTEYHAFERKSAATLEEAAERFALECKRRAERVADEAQRDKEAEKRRSKEKAAEEYKRYLEERNKELQREREDRTLRMQRVRQTAVRELQGKLDSANQEIRKQIEYRQSLGGQVKENQKVLEQELNELEVKQRPFTRKAERFRDAMERIDKAPGLESTNPVHPFRRVLEKHQANPVQLPLIGKSVQKIKIKLH